MTKTLDVSAWPQLAEILKEIGEDEAVVLTHNGRNIAEVKPLEKAVDSPKRRVWGSHPHSISYIADDFDAELPNSFWLGEE